MFPYHVVLTVAIGLLTGGGDTGAAVPAKDQPVAESRVGGACPKIYAPVTCDNGKTYPNQCVADRHHAQNCVPTGEL